MKKELESLTILSISSTSFILVLGNSMLLPILPEMRHDLHLTQVQTSFILSIYSIAGAVTIPFIGYISDRVSRKKVILLSLVLYGIGGLISGFASIISFPYSYEGIIFGRVIQGIGSAGTGPIAMAITADLFAGQKQLKVLGFIEASNSLGKVLSPIIGALIAAIMWYYIFFTFPIGCAIIFIIFYLFVNESNEKNADMSIKKYLHLLAKAFKKNKKFLLTAYSAGALCLFFLFGLLYYLTDALENIFDTHGFLNGMILSFPLLFLTLASFITGMKVGKYVKYHQSIVTVSFLVIAFSFLFLPVVSNLWLFLFVVTIISLAVGIILPCINGYITNSVEKLTRGLITSLYGSVRFIGISLGPIVFGFFLDKAIDTLFLISASIAFIQAILCFLYFSVDKRPSPREFVSSWLAIFKLAIFKR